MASTRALSRFREELKVEVMDDLAQLQDRHDPEEASGLRALRHDVAVTIGHLSGTLRRLDALIAADAIENAMHARTRARVGQWPAAPQQETTSAGQG